MGIARAISVAGLLVVFFIEASAIPLQMRGETSGLNEAVYTEPELMEALARSYGAIEWASRNERSEIPTLEQRNLDHIGGGNLLRRSLAITPENPKPKIAYSILTRGPYGEMISY
uniref:SPAC2E12.03c protein n=1 Tax=Fopius arisanus TaxID=64838 RepID=A0A0C9PHD2_9HYME